MHNRKRGICVLKKIMLYLMMLMTVYKGGALLFICITDFDRLPPALYISTGFMVLLGLGLGIRSFFKAVSSRMLEGYYCVGILSVAWNLFYMKCFTRLDVTLLDFLVIGTFMDILIGAALVVSAARESRYISIKVKSEV